MTYRSTGLTALRSHRGMTLIELVVVLGILAGLATLALTSLGGLDTSARRDTSERVINQIELAIAGDGREAGRFVSDMGRLPVIHGDDSSRVKGEGLMELWDDLGVYTAALSINFNGVSASEITNFWPAGNELSGLLPGGWQGPYINMGTGRLFDGFGNNLRFLKGGIWYEIDNAALNDMDAVLGVASFGSDDTLGAAEWEEEDVFTDESTKDAAISAELTISIRVRSHQQPYPWKQVNNITINDWAKGSTYFQGSIVRSGVAPDFDDLYFCTFCSNSSGVLVPTGAPTPFWSRNGIVYDDVDGDSVIDLQWVYLKPGCVSDAMNRMRIALFTPYADPDPTVGIGVREIIASKDGITAGALTDNLGIVNLVWPAGSSMDNIILQNLPPGIRRLYIYGYAQHSTLSNVWTNGWSSGLQTIDLKPGVNHITVYLSEPLP